MPTLISLKPKGAAPWQGSLGLDPAQLQASLEELAFSPEDSCVHVTLLMDAVPEDGVAFSQLRKALSALGKPRLRVRYSAGALSPLEYLALHFEDMLSLLKDEWGGD